MTKERRVVNLSVLPGEPLDGTGRTCIHLFVQDEKGPFAEPHVLHPALDEFGEPIKRKFVAKSTRGRLACDPKKFVAPRRLKGSGKGTHELLSITQRTGDPNAVTCSKCLASPEYKAMMSRIAELAGEQKPEVKE